MKPYYIKNIPMVSGEVTIVKARNANDVMQHSCEMARKIQRSGMSAMIVNTGLSKRRFQEAAETAGIDWAMSRNSMYAKQYSKARLLIHSTNAGELAGDVTELRYACIECQMHVMIVTSWEWASSSWRKKEKLLYELRQLSEELDIAIVIYTWAKTKTTAGEFDRGGTGRLATIAYAVAELEACQQTQQLTDHPSPIAFPDKEDAALFLESAQLLANEINKIPGVIMSSDEPKRSVIYPRGQSAGNRTKTLPRRPSGSLEGETEDDDLAVMA